MAKVKSNGFHKKNNFTLFIMIGGIIIVLLSALIVNTSKISSNPQAGFKCPKKEVYGRIVGGKCLEAGSKISWWGNGQSSIKGQECKRIKPDWSQRRKAKRYNTPLPPDRVFYCFYI